MNLKDEKLKKLWEKYVLNKYAYRAQSEEHLKKILKKGFNPHECPYIKIRPKLEKLYNLVLNLEKKGYKMTLDWKGVYPSGKKAVRVSRCDLDSPFIDFAIDLKETRSFLRRFKGGAIASNIVELINGIKKFNIKLTKSQEKIIEECAKWAKKKQSFRNKLLRINLNIRAFEVAKFHILGEENYWISPYGSFDNFKKVIKKYGLKKYEPCLKGNRKAYLRITSKIPATNIEMTK